MMAKSRKRHELPAVAHWLRATKFDFAGCALADGHYSRRTPGAPQFLPPGDTIALVTRDELACWGWWRPAQCSGLKSMNGLDGWTCSIFRNTGPVLSSDLILAAEEVISVLGVPPGPDGLLTYVWDQKVRSANPGYCFKMAGWHVAGLAGCCPHMRRRSADGRKTLLHKAWGGGARAAGA